MVEQTLFVSCRDALSAERTLYADCFRSISVESWSFDARITTSELDQAGEVTETLYHRTPRIDTHRCKLRYIDGLVLGAVQLQRSSYGPIGTRNVYYGINAH